MTYLVAVFSCVLAFGSGVLGQRLKLYPGPRGSLAFGFAPESEKPLGPGYQTRKSLETPPNTLGTHKNTTTMRLKSSLFLYFGPFSSNLRDRVKLSYKVL